MASAQFDKGKHTFLQVITGIIPHCFRERENYANEEIDISRSDLNQKFGCSTGDEARAKYKARVKECDELHPPKRVKKDRKTSLGIHIPSPREGLNTKELHQFFTEVYKKLEELFGEENVIFGVSHFDEVHEYYDPHDKQNHISREGLHVEVIPWTDSMDWIPEKYRAGLNMNNFYRRSLPTMINNALDEVCNEVFGFDYQDGRKTRNKESVEELKEVSKTIEEQNELIAKNSRTLESLEVWIADAESRASELEEKQNHIMKREQQLTERQAAFEEEKTAWKESAEKHLKDKEDGMRRSLQRYKQKWHVKHREEIEEKLRAEYEEKNKQELQKDLRQQVDNVRAYRLWLRTRNLDKANENADCDKTKNMSLL